MGTIVARKRKDKSVGYTAQIVIKREGRIVHREAKTFDRRPAAALWLEKREKLLREPGGIDRSKSGDPTLGEVIDRYIKESVKEIGRTKAQVLRAIKQYDIARKRVSEIGSPDVVAFATELAGKVQPQTVGNYLSHMGAVFAIARPAWGYPLDPDGMTDAFKVTNRLGISSKSNRRDRRPSLEELDALMAFFVERQERAPDSAPMHKIIPYALFSTRRLEEIVRPLWKHLDEAGSRLLVKDMKHPGQKTGNDVWCDLTPEALGIIQTMDRRTERIFPYTDDAIGASFTRACKVLGIADLHFHDLRHEGVSRLFEMGRNIPHVAAVSGHRSWASLQRYTHLRQTGDKYANWEWKRVWRDPLSVRGM